MTYKRFCWLTNPEWVPVLEEVLVDVYPGVPPVHVEVQRVGDGEVTVVDHEHVADMDLNLDQVGL